MTADIGQLIEDGDHVAAVDAGAAAEPAWLAAPASAGAQGGDFGAGISAALGAVAPEHVVGVHVTCLPTRPVPDAGIELSETDSARLDKTRQLMANRPPYQALQARTPQTAQALVGVRARRPLSRDGSAGAPRGRRPGLFQIGRAHV